jgi:hypothetical protein
MIRAAVWVFHSRRMVLVSEDISPPVDADEGLGVFEDLPMFGWGKAGEVANEKAEQLGYVVEYQPLISDIVEEDDEGYGEDED